MLHDALVYLAAAVLAVPLFHWLGLGAVLGYLVAGVVIGPGVLGFAHDPAEVLHFSELGVVLLLFIIGLELEPAKLWRMRTGIFGLGGLQMLVTAGLLGLGAHLAGADATCAAVVGIAFAMSSTAIGLVVLRERGLLAGAGGQAAFAVLLAQDLAVVPALLAVGALGGASTGFDWMLLVRGVALVASFLLLGRYALRPLLRLVANTRMREAFVAFSLLLVVGAASAALAAGLSAALGTFLAGVLLANSEYRHELEIDIEPFKGLLLGLFFMAIGMNLDLGLIASEPLRLLLAAAAVILAKALVLAALGALFRLSAGDVAHFAAGLAQVGEFAFVIAGAALATGAIDAGEAGRLSVVATLTMFATPFVFAGVERLVAARLNPAEEAPTPVIDDRGEAIVAGFGRVGQMVARMLLGRGHRVVIIDNDANHVELARRFGWKTFYGNAARRDTLDAAGIAEARLLVLAIDDPEATLATVRLVRDRYPQVPMLVRAKSRIDAFELVELGVPFERETFLGAVRLGERALVALGESEAQAAATAAAFREHDLAMLRAAAAHRHDQEKLIAIVAQGRVELEALLAREEAEPAKQDPASAATA